MTEISKKCQFGGYTKDLSILLGPPSIWKGWCGGKGWNEERAVGRAVAGWHWGQVRDCCKLWCRRSLTEVLPSSDDQSFLPWLTQAPHPSCPCHSLLSHTADHYPHSHRQMCTRDAQKGKDFTNLPQMFQDCEINQNYLHSIKIPSRLRNTNHPSHSKLCLFI